MSDTETSGSELAEPAATPSVSAQQNSDDSAQERSEFAFGASRGSGLARGKRNTKPAPDAPATAQQPEANGYQPTAIEVITPKSEYSNPFTGETVVETVRETPPAPAAQAPVAEAPARPSPKEDADEDRTDRTEGRADSRNAATAEPEPTAPPAAKLEKEAVAETGEAAAEAEQPKPELKILPPAETNRDGQSWESPSQHPAHRAAARAEARGSAQPTSDGDGAPGESAERPRARSRSPRGSTEGRPTFQPERRERSPRSDTEDPRAPRAESPREPRPKREPSAAREPRARTERSPRTSATPAKPQGFFGWLKSLFGGANSQPSSGHSGARGEGSREGFDGQRRRSRGGRGRGTGGGHTRQAGGEGRESRGSSRGQYSESREARSEGNKDSERPRRRSSRGGRGGRARGPREGQQSGGAI